MWDVKRKVRAQVELNITPLIDVVFLLLIFFVLTTTFKDHAVIAVDLPHAEITTEANAQDSIEITVDATGHYYVNGQAVFSSQPEILQQRLHYVREQLNAPQVMLKADAKTPHQAVVTALTACQHAGLDKVKILTKKTAAVNAS